MSTAGTGALGYLISHVVLPPNLPSHDDNTAEHEKELLGMALRALQVVKTKLDTTEPVISQMFDAAITTIENMTRLRNDQGMVAENQLATLLKDLATNSSTQVLPIEVNAQNAAVLATRCGSNVIFELFELLPQDEPVMSTKGRLLRSFPTKAYRISAGALLENGLIRTLAQTLASLSHQEVLEFRLKSGVTQNSPYDTTHPGLVSEFFASILTAIAEPEVVDTISKYTRQDVVCSSSALPPWRRSSLWLLVRVTLQLVFVRNTEKNDLGIGLYKVWMAQVIADVLRKASKESLDAEIVHMISAKLTRRLRKLKLPCNDLYIACINPIRSLLLETHQKMQVAWCEAMESTESNIDLKILSTLQPKSDVYFDLKQLDRWLARISSRKECSPSTQFQPTSELPAFDNVGLLLDTHFDGEFKYIHLFVVEAWVKEELWDWLQCEIDQEKTCERLRDLIRAYYDKASEVYTDSDAPTSISVMHLTIAELWVASDKCACHVFPLLKEYDPEVDVTLLRDLSLPTRSQMDRLSKIEKYLKARKKNASQGLPSLFYSFGHDQSFAVRFYDQSPRHKNLHTQIEREALANRKKKQREYEEKKKQYRSLMDEWSNLECNDHKVDYVGRRKRKVYTNTDDCVRCNKLKEAQAISIEVFEWPLSTVQAEAKAVVFELMLPAQYSNWRDTTLFLIMKVLGFQRKPETWKLAVHTLYKYQGLSRYRKVVHNQLIGLFSPAKPLSGTPKKMLQHALLLKEEDVCVENELKYKLFELNDKNKTQYALEELGRTSEVQQKCMYKLPERSKKLQRYLTPTSTQGVTPNSIMASLSDCPEIFSIPEYKAFSALSLGYNIQYSNILTQLASPTVDFSKPETQTMIQQMVHLAGVETDDNIPERAAHSILTNDGFSHTMLLEIEKTLRRYESNWESWRALATCIILVLRILEINKSGEITEYCLELLSTARQISSDWVQVLAQRSRNARDSKQDKEIIFRKTEVALVCISTFDVDEKHFDHILDSVSTLIRMSIIVQETKDIVCSDHRFIYLASLQSWRSLLFRIFPKIQEGIDSGHLGRSLDEALQVSYPDLTPSTEWYTLPEPRHMWAEVTCENLSVHFNLLTAELLVEGKAMTRLPTNYVEHETYTCLFDGVPMEATSTNERGMSFSAKHTHAGYTVKFGLDRGDLLIVAAQDDQKFDLVPSRLLENIMPTHFVRRFVHWYNHESEEIEFRNYHTPWKSESGSWILKRSGAGWVLENTHFLHINPTSNTGEKLLDIFSPLEDRKHIHVMLEKATAMVTVKLHRLHMEFDMPSRKDRIMSRQYSGMVIDSDQRIGTLIGLNSKLVMRDEQNADNRLVLIPEGCFKHEKISDKMTINVEQCTIIKIHSYQIDKVLNRIVDNSSLRSKFLLALLHGLTSHCLADCATGHTGTENALLILRSAAGSSSDKLTAEDMNLLEAIVKFAPRRSFLSSSVKVMEKTQWDLQLPIMSQHPGYFTEVDRIFAEYKNRSILHGRCTQNKMFNSEAWNSLLLSRHMIRSSIFRVDGFGAEFYTREFDSVYTGRDSSLRSARSARAFAAAKMVLRDEFHLHTTIEAPDLRAFMLKYYFHNKIVKGTDQVHELASLKFQANWLEDPSTFLSKIWCTLHTSLSASPKLFDKFTVMTWLSALAFAKTASMDVVQTLAAMYRVPDIKSSWIPLHRDFYLTDTWDPSQERIRNSVEYGKRMYAGSPDSKIKQRPNEDRHQWQARKRTLFQTNQTQKIDALAKAVYEQWPSASLFNPVIENAAAYIDVDAVMKELRSKFQIWFNNHLFYGYLGRLSLALKYIQVTPITEKEIPPAPYPGKKIYGNIDHFFSKQVLFDMKAPLGNRSADFHGTLTWPIEPDINLAWSVTSTFDHRIGLHDSLGLLCDKLDSVAASSAEEKYVSDLRDSRRSLKSIQEQVQILAAGDIEDILQTYYAECQSYLENVNQMLRNVVTSDEDIETRLNHCPRLCTTFWLAQLHKDRFNTLSEGWKKAMINYGLSITKLQRSKRLLTLSKRPVELAQELRNVGHENWDPHEFPETLLLEVESGILVRQIQEEIANQMRNPPADQNSVMVLNMGEGKSSVIAPIVAAALSDRNILVRVIVAKPQRKQMQQTLIEKLGGLLNRRIYYIPFERSQKFTATEVKTIGEIFKECAQNRGILLQQPEHILSFQNMGIEALIADKPDIAQPLLQIQEFLDSKSRDIVDESDENFSAKFELVYTVGSQTAIEMCPLRWKITHAILDLVAQYAPQVKLEYPNSIEINYHEDKGFPRVRLLKDDATERLLDMIADHICRVNFPFLGISRQQPGIQEIAKSFIRNSNISDEQIQRVEESSLWNESMRGTLLLVRGLIASGILKFALKNKRYRVNYGLDLVRIPKTSLAVPYRSKDSPSPGSEFSHPEVVIVLTSLTYYYGGLTNDDLFNTFSQLLRIDQANMEYQNWIRSATKPLPESFRHLNGINLEDRFQCIQNVFPALRYSKAAIDFHLSSVVFPKGMKEFSHKLSASGWDIGKVKPCPTTGFSGTSDARHTLPLSVHHLDLPMQKSTNALVLKHLMEAENSIVLLQQQDGASDKMSDADHLINTINNMNPETRVLLDVGAQIIELNNLQVARKWLDISQENVKAVVFFNDEEELSILDRDGRVEPLQISPFAKQMDVCLVYLDESHTRGTDLRLPAKYRAAVTLGANLTKDRLVQACMRMRSLAKEQSVVFCISEEIASKILEVTSKARATDIEVSDVLIWAITETWQDLKRTIPLWATQGRRFEKNKPLQNGSETTKQQAELLLEEDGQTISRRYQPRRQGENESLVGWDTTNVNIMKIIRRCQDLGALNFNSTSLSEEQERELATEIEEELQIQRPQAMKAEAHSLHPDLQQLVITGVLKKGSPAYMPAFEALDSTSAAGTFWVADFPKDLMVTVDFIRTVKRPAGISSKPCATDSYHRPVQWVLAVYKRITRSQQKPPVQNLVILSPFEAHHMIRKIKNSDLVSLHTYAPRTSLVYEPLDSLDLFSIGRSFDPSLLPRSLVAQLNLYAGQLYFKSYDEYVELCGFLGLSHLQTWEGRTVQPDDGFVVPPIGEWGFKTSPVRFLREFISKIRREGGGMDKTHVGRMLDGKMLTADDFEESLFVGDDE